MNKRLYFLGAANEETNLCAKSFIFNPFFWYIERNDWNQFFCICVAYTNDYSPQCHWKWRIFTPLLSSYIHHYSPLVRWIFVNYSVHQCELYMYFDIMVDPSFWLFFFFSLMILNPLVGIFFCYGFPPKGKLNSLVRNANFENKVDIIAFHYYPPDPTSTTSLNLRGSQWSSVRVNSSFRCI